MNYPRFVVVEFHVSDAYAMTWGNARGAGFYDIWASGVPWFAYDGLFDAWPFEEYEIKLQQRLAVPTDVTLELSGVEMAADTWEFTAEVHQAAQIKWPFVAAAMFADGFESGDASAVVP